MKHKTYILKTERYFDGKVNPYFLPAFNSLVLQKEVKNQIWK